MKKIEALIRKEKFPDVDLALKNIGVGGLTVLDAKGRGRSELTVTYYARGKWSYTTDYINRVNVVIVVADAFVDKAVEAILKSASTNSVGDGKIFISPLENAIDIGTGEVDGCALESPPV